MRRESLAGPINPYHYILHCIGGKWKITILHEIYTYGSIRFNQTLRVLSISEKVLSQQLKELARDGLIERIVDSNTHPPTIDYQLTDAGRELMPTLDHLCRWTIRHMAQERIPVAELRAYLAEKLAY